MTIHQILATLRARWLAALLAFALVVGAVVGITLLLPKRYAATATVLLDIKNTDPISGQNFGGIAPLSYMITQVDLLKSGRVVRRVIQNLGLANNPTLRDQWREDTDGVGDFESWLVDRLRLNLEARPTRDSGALDITYKSPSGAFSAAMANAFAQAFLEVNLELRTEPARQFNSFFDQRTKAARDALESAQARLSAYQRDRGLLATDERFDIETARLQELSTQAVMLQALAAESASRTVQANANGDRLSDVLNSGLVSSLTADVSRQQARLEELSARLGDANPQVVELKASIAELRRRIAAETSRVTGSVSVTNNVTQSRLTQVQAALADQRAKVLRLKQQRDEASVLERELEAAKIAYQSVAQRQNQTGLESQTNQSNISIIERASEPTEPSSPRVLLNTAISIVLGLIVALAFALMREWRDRRLRSLDDVTDVLQIPLLGVLPKSSPKELARESAKAIPVLAAGLAH